MTSLGRSPRKPKESSGRGNYPTAGDIAAEVDDDAQVAEAESLTHDDYRIDVDRPSYDDPAVAVVAATAVPPAAVVSAPVREPEKTVPKARKQKSANEPRQKKGKAPRPVKEPKPAKEPRQKKEKAPKVPRPPKVRNSEPGRGLTILAVVVGVVGLLFSVILAVGALFIALDAAQGSAFFDALSSTCDALVGPLKDVFTFSGANADKKQALVGWGLGSMGYLLLGRFLQSMIQSRVKN